jgi:murein DD-endopeptidase MepM/ murein hydrolase activator NlpD
VSEIRFHSGDPTRPAASATIGPFAGSLIAATLLLSGGLVALGLMAAHNLISGLVRSADRTAVRETARRGAEAFASVARRQARIAARLLADELFLARVARIVDVPLPPGFPAASRTSPEGAPDDIETEIAALARRLRAFEIFRRRIASNPTGGVNPPRIPSRSPVEPSTAVVLTSFGPHVSPLTKRLEFFPGLELAAPAGAAVVAPAEGTVVFAGPAPRKSEAAWRRLGTILVLQHDDRTRTIYGHLERILAKKRRRVGRGEPVARVGQTGFSPTPRLHYEVRQLTGDVFLPVDPRLFILDVDWITAAELRETPSPPADMDLPPPFR